ncbi:MAG: hypothetical protein D6828_02570, partial [Nitrospirae bacterium]
ASMSSKTLEYSVFELIDAIMSRDRDRAFNVLRNLFVSKGVSSLSIIGALVWHYGQLYRVWETPHMRPKDIHQRRFNELSKQSRYCKGDFFFKVFKALYEAEVTIKSSAREEVVLETLLVRLLESLG